MQILAQIAAVTRLNLRSVPQRPGTSSIVVIGIAGVACVLVTILAMVSGLDQVMTSKGRTDRAIAIGSGSGFEVLSNLSREAAQTIEQAPGIRRATDGSSLASAEALAIVQLPLRKSGSPANLSFRGVSAGASAVRPELRIVAGRMFEPAVRELIVGRGAQGQFLGLQVGSVIRLRGADWNVVGLFESNGDPHETELMTGVATLQAAFGRSAFQSVTLMLDSPEAFLGLRAALAAIPSLPIEVLRETDYYAQQSRAFTRLLSVIAYLIGGIMAIGAVFAALNAMYTAVSGRAVEIATLRVLGFGAAAVAISVFAEALLLALLGGILGGGLAWLLFNGDTVSTNAAGATQMAIPFVVGPGIIGFGISWACIIGIAGASFPAIQAARAPLARALRGS